MIEGDVPEHIPPQPPVEAWRWFGTRAARAARIEAIEATRAAVLDALPPGKVRAMVGDVFGDVIRADPPDAMPNRLVLRCDGLVWSADEVHRRWVAATERGEDVKHPLAPLVEAWQAMPRTVEADRKPTGIMPGFAGTQLHAPSIIRPDPEDRIFRPSIALVRPDPAGQRWLPGLGLEVGDVPAFLLAILDAGAGRKRGPGAPGRDRALVEILLSVPTSVRADGERHRIRDLTIADAVEWMGWNPRHYRPDADDYGRALEGFLQAVATVRLPLNDRGGWLVPAMVEAIRGRELADPIIPSVLLMPGSKHGARVVRSVLRQAGRVSAVAWRLYLHFCFDWDRISHRGKLPRLERPEVRRNVRGQLVDAAGAPIMRKGKAVTDWRDPRAVHTGGFEPNPVARSLHRTYDGPGDLVRAAWPIDVPSDRHRARDEKRVVEAVRWLAGERDAATGKPLLLNRQAIDAPGVVIVREGRPTENNPHRFPWRVIRPEAAAPKPKR